MGEGYAYFFWHRGVYGDANGLYDGTCPAGESCWSWWQFLSRNPLQLDRYSMFVRRYASQSAR